MWPDDFETRLQDWNDLRDQCRHPGDLDDILGQINDWWFRAPMVNRYLHWHDFKKWPTAWELLNDNIYCELARALGMLYTIHMLDSDLIDDVVLTQSDIGNLVLVNQGKYILNWTPGALLNITSQQFTINQQLDSRALHHLMG
jgi:hypothetical protein